MANITEHPVWEDGIYQIERRDPLTGGPEGSCNIQAKQLANRTLFLKEKQEEAQNLLERFGIGHLADSFPSGLSGGEIRRMSIARTLINHPKILLADEPTGDLDPVNTELVLELFRNITKEKVTVISVTHENENPMYAADAVYKMDGGSLSLIRTGG